MNFSSKNIRNDSKSILVIHKSNCLPCITKALNYLKKTNNLDNLKVVILYSSIADKQKNIEDIRMFEDLKQKPIKSQKKRYEFSNIKLNAEKYGPSLIIFSNNKTEFYDVALIDSIM